MNKVELFKFKDENRSITVTATVKENALTVEDHSLDKALESINGRPEREVIISLEGETYQALVLSLIKEKFNGNSAISDFTEWLSQNKIKYTRNTF